MLEINNKTKRKLTAREIFLFKKIFKTVFGAVGAKYQLSMVICTDKISKHNTLAYPLSKTEGEILLNPSRAGQYSLPYLFLHSCVHLRGLDHGKKMDALEEKYLKMLKLDKRVKAR